MTDAPAAGAGTIAIDPAARNFAYAIFHDGELARCGYAHNVTAFLRSLDPERQYVWVLETPRNYGRFAVAHKDLDRLRKTLARLRKGIRARGEDIVQHAPSAWKGNVPKQIHHQRVWAILSVKERICLPDRPGRIDYAHDVHDAVALGLFHLGRTKRGGKTT